MGRILIVFGIIFLAIIGFFYYDHTSIKNEEANRQAFDMVMTDKMRQLSEQAQDRAKPVNIDIHDARLKGDYKILSEFLLKYWIKNIDTRNAYLNQLAAAKWDHFLDVNRLDADRKQNYLETTQMLGTVRQAMQQYQQNNMKNKNEALAELKKSTLRKDLKKPLQDKLEQSAQLDPENALILNELQILGKAETMFDMLKKNQWQKQGNQILFKEDAQVKQFNQLYQDVLKLNSQINQKKEQNAEVLQEAL
ncbi:MAG: hypothetical protein VX125_14800 [Pseudomonadota bacterium]|uniref:Uncharacterized protein n=1 Tax=Acinetobacter bereziniae TaxID=106648 RepID=A0A8I1AGY5_ACIBZ|nr:hypothetical protein [Acinetobacter bereziniae]MEC8125087.1 hypothetical protein [Pseudomonadota bacterium]QQC85042.1 hypothetical protein I9190_01615 [Acinetobacter bereziniae]UUN98195.1 hypothetical protein I9054_001610 [Acinetobacter bereziniae]